MTGFFQPQEIDIFCELGNGPFINEKRMGEKFSNGYVDIEYYDADPRSGSANRVIPSAGSLICTVTRSEDPNDANAQFGTIPNGTVAANDPAYNRPSWAGHTTFLKVTEDVAVVGAVWAWVRILRT